MKTKTLSSLFFLLMIAAGLFAQPVVIVNENFDKTQSNFTAPRGGWSADTTLHFSGSRSFLGIVPTQPGDSVELISGWFDCQKYSNVLLQFNHICKVSVCDFATVEYQIDQLGAKWQKLPLDCYKGTRTPYRMVRFSHKSYDVWMPNDSLATPTNSWWKTELFDLSTEVSWEKVRFKFKIKRGSVVGTQFAYGWLVDDFILYGATSQIDIPAVEFITKPADTVYQTGPFRIRAKVATRTISPIITPKVQLVYLYNGLKTYDSIPMHKVEGDSIWEAEIPQQYFGTLISYSITGKDGLNNSKTITGQTFVKRYASNGFLGYWQTSATFSPVSTYALPSWQNYTYGWTRQLYTNDELHGGGMITRMAYNVVVLGAAASKNQLVYFKLVDDTMISGNNYINPVNEGYTLVYSGEWNPTSSGWCEIELDNPFVVPAGKNLMVIWVNNSGTTCNPYASTRVVYTPNPQALYSTSATGTGTYPTYNDASLGNQYYKSVARFYFSGCSYRNSVSLLEIESPKTTVSAGVSTPVVVSIKNEGMNNLTSCTINWSLNGTLQTPYNWTGNLPDNYIDTNITIGSYVPRTNQYDNLVVWVSNPNHVLDSALTDDTLSISTYGCTAPFSGNYIVGTGKGADFTTLTDAVNKLKLCGSNGNVHLQLQSGSYTYFSLTDMTSVMGKDTLFITSLTGKKEDVIFRGNGNQYIFSLNGANNVVVENISLIRNSTSTVYGFYLQNKITNIIIRNCHVYMDSVATASGVYALYKPSTVPCENVSIIGNEFIGGYYTFYFYGGNSTSAYGKNVIFDHNFVAGAYYYGYYIYYTDFISFSHNRFYARAKNVNNYFYNYIYYCNLEKCNGNRFDYLDFTGTYIYNYYYYVNLYNTNDRGLFCNNEYIGHKKATGGYGMYLGYSNLDVYNNTFICRTSYPLYLYNYNQGIANITNNIFVNLASSGQMYPVYMPNATAAAGIGTIDYNLYYSPKSVGYWSGNKTSIAAWRQATKQDANSLYMKPVFFNLPDLDTLIANPKMFDTLNWVHSLNLAVYAGLDCPVPAGLTDDILGTPRTGNTIMGCYSASPMKLDAAISGLTGIGSSVVKGQQLTVSAILTNMGETTLTSANIGWSLNGVQKTGKVWSGSLGTYASDTVYLDVLTVNSVNNQLKIWVKNPNNMLDSNERNDTLIHNFNGCDSMYHGTYTIGYNNADFATVNEAMEAFSLCGINAPVVLSVQSGTYDGFTISKIQGLSSKNTITITSASGKAEDVVFVTTSGYTLIVNGMDHVRFNKISIDGTGGTGAVFMTGLCRDVWFDGCLMKAKPASGNYVFYKPSGAPGDSIFLQNNVFEGGYYGLYFYGQGTSANGYNTNVHIDSNLFLNAYYYGHYFYYNDLTSFSYNTIRSNTSNNYFYNYFYYCNHYNTQGNTYDLSKSAVQYLYNYMYYPHRYNYTGTDGYFINNQVICSPKATGGYCLYLGYVGETQHIYHNSFYNPGASGYGIYGYFSSGGTNPNVDIANNMIWSNNYPIYTTGTVVQAVSYNNNLYNPTGRVGYWAGKPCTSLTAWATESGDNTSVSIQPNFLDMEQFGMELGSNRGLTCPGLGNVNTDILKQTRNNPTTIGAFEFVSRSNDVNMVAITQPSQGQTLKSGVSVPVSVVIQNISTDNTKLTSLDVDWTLNGVSMPVYHWTGSLASFAYDTLHIGTIKPTAGNVVLKAWSSKPNSSYDERPSNDTAVSTLFACDSMFSGTYTVGRGGYFHDLADFESTVGKCGLDGPVTLRLLNGRFAGIRLDNAIVGTSATNTITITSAANNVDSVIIYNPDGLVPTVSFNGGISHVILEKVTILGSAETDGDMSAVGMFDCDYITVRDCKLRCFGTSEYNKYPASGFTNVESATGNYGNIGTLNMQRNKITGVFDGTYIIDRNNRGQISFTDNYIQFRAGNYFEAHPVNFSDNTFEFDKDSAFIKGVDFNFDTWNGHSHGYDTLRICRNRFLMYGDMDNFNWYMYGVSPDSCLLFTNNEMIGPNSSYSYFDIDGCDNMYFVNNSIYMPSVQDFYLNYNRNFYMANNLIISPVIPYLDGNSYLYSDYNNVCGFDLEDWQTETRLDSHSVSVMPMFADVTKSLDMLDNTGLSCPRESLVMDDIKGRTRSAVTTIGCYEVAAIGNNVMPRAMVTPQVVITGKKTQLVATILNAGSNTVTSFKVYAKVRGNLLPSYVWSGSLASKAQVNVTIGDFVPVADTNRIVIWTSQPNNGVDSLPDNDTLYTYVIGCDSILHGDYYISSNVAWKRIVTTLQSCGLDAPVRIRLAKGKYDAISLMKEIPGATHANNVTFMSDAEAPEDVVINGTMELSHVNHVNFKYLTFDGIDSTYTVYFDNVCKDIEFYGCHILASRTTTSTEIGGYAVGLRTYSFAMDSIRFIKNLIDGGYYGLQIYGQGTNNMTTNMVVDSNVFQNQYYYATYFYYVDFVSCSHNTILSRTSNANNYWYGLEAYYSNIPECDGNRIHQRSSSIGYPYPAYFYYHGMYGSQATTNFTNNEIMASASGTNTPSAVYIYGSNINVFHNTIKMSGSSSRAVYVGGTGSMILNNNVLVTDGASSIPIYMGTVGCAQPDYNCIYAPTYAGYSGGNLTFANWQASGYDIHSVRVKPTFEQRDSNCFLKLSKYDGLFVPVLPSVKNDRMGTPRAGMTIMGAYTTEQQKVDAALVEFVNLSTSAVIGNTVPVSVRLINMGSDSINLTSAEINWYVRGVKQSPVKWTGSLAPYQDVVVALGSFRPVAGPNVLAARVFNPNSMKDLEPLNDSVVTTVYGCDSLLHGTYTVGNANSSSRADFATITAALDALSHCGVDGPTTFLLASGTYSELTVGSFNGASHQNMVTFASATGKASDVVFSGTYHLTLNAAKHVRFENLTFGKNNGTRGVTFSGSCKDIEFYHCEILLSTTSTSTEYAVYKPSGGVLDSIRFIGNHISGGYYSVYFYGNSTSNGGYNTNIIFDSNLVENAYYYMYYFYYNDILSFCYNTFLPRVSGSTTMYNYMYYCNLERMEGNRYNTSRGKSLNNFYNYVYYANTYNVRSDGRKAGLMCNNESINTAGNGYAWYLGYGNLDFINNSAFSSSAPQAIYSYNSSNSMLLKNNNIVALAGVSMNLYGKSSVKFESNNMYGTSGITVEGTTYSTYNDIVAATGDTNLTMVVPSYIDRSVSLEQKDYVGLVCTKDPNVSADITGANRSKVTVRGAYSVAVEDGKNLELTNIVSPRLNTLVACYPDFSTAEVEITNMGTEDIDFANDKVRVCMSSDSANVFYVDTVLSSGIMKPMAKMNLKLTDLFPTSATGFYNIKAWIECAKDKFSYDDTAYTVYEVTRVVLPFETDFTEIPMEFAFDSIQGSIQWELSETGPTPAAGITPDFGTGMLHFGSSTGRASLSRAVIKQVDLLGSTKPQVSFWYAHDNANPGAPDYVELLASTDGGATYKRLMTVYRYDANCKTPTWKMYQYDLSAYVKETCLHLAFEAGSYGGGDQNIDRIRINVEQDMEVSSFLLSDSLTACDLKGRALDVVLTNSTMYDVNYERPDSVRIYVSLMKPDSSVTNVSKVLRGRLYANTIDTLRVVDSYDFDQPGTYTLRAYVDTVTATTVAANDTLVYRFDVLPDLSVVGIDTIYTMSSGDVVKPTVYVVNTGNLTAEKVSLRMKVNDENDIVEVSNQPLKAGDTLKYTFTQGFTVPDVSADQPFYFLSVESEMSCDMDATNDVYNYVGGVNLKDMSVYSIGTPNPQICDTGKKEIYVNINLYNYSDVVVDSATVHVIVDSANTVYAEFTELVTNVAVGNTNMSLHTSYKVPNFNGTYKVTVYVENVKGEMNNSNDTASVEVCAVKNDVSVKDFDADLFQLGQNIPNPAALRTVIPFNLPQDGNVRLSVMSANGQMLLTTEIRANAGSNNYELDVEQLAAGIYYYSMEYKGQRLVRKMNVVR